MQPLVLQILAIFLLRNEKDTTLSPLSHTARNAKLGGAWEQGYPLDNPMMHQYIKNMHHNYSYKYHHSRKSENITFMVI